jgi:hypothetical protein
VNKIIFPRGFAFAVDDLGWNQGSNLLEDLAQGPPRAGVRRDFDLKDYQFLVEIGKAVNTRIQCLFILSEMDRENILAKYPTTTYQREKWNNTFRVNDTQKVIMNYVRDQAAHMEFGFHGLGHEYWPPGSPQKRAEWYNLFDKEPWPEESLREHIKCFQNIMAQYGFSKANGHSFPESFVPCAYSYYWNPQGEYSLGKLLREAGVKYANTDFGQVPELNPPSGIDGGGFDFGVHVINRVNYGNLWYKLSALPTVPLEYQKTDIIESHWPNWLAQDDFLQPDVTASWIQYYKDVQRMADRYIAKNTEQLHSQWLYKRHAKVVEKKKGQVTIDNTQMHDDAYRYDVLGNMVLKIKLRQGQHISSAKLGSEPIPCYFEEEGYGFFYLPVLKKERYIFQYEIGKEAIQNCIFNDGTYSVYALKAQDESISFDVKVYGRQNIRVRCQEPKTVYSDSNRLLIQNYQYNSLNGELIISVQATNMQGSNGNISLFY